MNGIFSRTLLALVLSQRPPLFVKRFAAIRLAESIPVEVVLSIVQGRCGATRTGLKRRMVHA